MAGPTDTSTTVARPGGAAGVVVHDEPGLRLTRFAPARPRGAAVLLVPPLAVPAWVYDLRPGHSLVQHLLDAGHPVHLLDYGHVGYAQRRLGLEHWVDHVLPTAVRVAASHDGRVHVAGWSLGGTLGLLTLAAHAELPVRSLTALATPVDYTRVPLYRPVVLAARLTGGRFTSALTRTLGGAPGPVVQAGYRAIGVTRELQRPLMGLRYRDDPDRLAHERAVDAFLRAMPGYPGRFFLQLWHRVIVGGQLARGVVEVGGRDVRLAAIDVPVLAVGSHDDEIASWDSVEAVAALLTGAPEVRVAAVGGRHLGVLTGIPARTTTWPLLTGFLADVDA